MSALRPLGFLLLMLGFGLRLDSGWQGLAWLLLVLGGALSAAGLVRGGPRAFVPSDDGR